MFQTPDKAPSRLGLYLPFGALILAIIVHGIYWMVASNGIKSAAEDWITSQESAGYTIAHDGVRVGGYPFRFTIVVSRPDITAPQSDGGWNARFDRVAASAQFYALGHWIVTLGESGELATQIDGEAARYSLSAESARFSLRMRDGVTHEVGAEVTQFAMEALEGPAPVIVGLETFLLTGRTGDDDTLRARIQTKGTVFNDTVLSTPLREAFGDTAQLFRLDAELSQFSALARAGDPRAWTRAGGRMLVNGAQLDWGPATLVGQGDITLDRESRPAGRLSVVVSDPESLISALEAAGMVQEDQGAALRLAAMMAPRRDQGIALPFRLQDGGLFLGPARIGSIQPLD